MMEDILGWKKSFNERLPSLEDEPQLRRPLLMEDDL